MDWLFLVGIIALAIIILKLLPIVRVLLMSKEQTSFFALKHYIKQQGINPDEIPNCCLEEIISKTLAYLSAPYKTKRNLYFSLDGMLQQDAESIRKIINNAKGIEPYQTMFHEIFVENILKKNNVI